MTTGAIYPSLKGKTVLVTGGGSGIGESIVRHFVAQGARVGFLDINREASEKLVAELSPTGSVHFEHCDLRDIAALRTAIANVRAAFGPITILVNNAAHDERHKLEDVTPEYWDDRVQVNLRHQFFAAQAVVDDMKTAGGGAIINLGSTSWMIGLGGMPAYTASKSAVLGLTRSLARDLGPFNIRVCSVVPGWIMTQRQIDLWLTPEAEARVMESQCLKRKLYPEDIAKPVLFFASDEASGCTNQAYVVDGGWI
ncbi:MAG TPA: SDR family oxidoreductase [Kaistia sp.]|nr:SDR family oxidoreductase [Kaistia sp.]